MRRLTFFAWQHLLSVSSSRIGGASCVLAQRVLQASICVMLAHWPSLEMQESSGLASLTAQCYSGKGCHAETVL